MKPMLAKPQRHSRGAASFLDVKFTCEYKYDGERAQIHLLPDGTVKIFSRNQEDNTPKFPDVIRALPGYLQEGVQSVVIDAEAVAFDRDAGKILPFQILSTRGRKNIDEEDIKVRVAIYAFDCLFLNGVNLLQEPLTKRREALYSAFKEVPGEFFFVTAKISRDVDELQVFLEDSIAENTEGLIVKTMDATYEPSKRSLNWLKLKKDYMEGCGDSLDLVPIGAFHGRGKRTGVYGAYLLACYDEETEDLQSICKIGTGFSDEDLNALSESLRGTVIDAPRRTSNGDFKPDVWFDPSRVEVSGGSLRVPAHQAAKARGPNKGIARVSRDFFGGARTRRWRWRLPLSRWRTFTARRSTGQPHRRRGWALERDDARGGRLRVHKSWSRECRVARRVAFERGDLFRRRRRRLPVPRGDSGYFVVRFRRCRRPGFRQWSARGVGVSRAKFEPTLARLSTSGERRRGARRGGAWCGRGVHRAMRGRGPGRGAVVAAGSSSTANVRRGRRRRASRRPRARRSLLDMKQRTTHDDPEGFMGTSLRLRGCTNRHLEASYEEFLEGIPAPPPLATTSRSRGDSSSTSTWTVSSPVAALGRPELASLPVAVSWSSSGGGELSSCNYSARALGDAAGMRPHPPTSAPTSSSPYEFDRYSPWPSTSTASSTTFRRTSWASPSTRRTWTPPPIFGPGPVGADARARILAETGCVASVGSGPNRLIARLATKRAKPDGAYHVAQRDAGVFAGVSRRIFRGWVRRRRSCVARAWAARARER